MKYIKRLLAVLLAALLLAGGIAVHAAPSLTVTAVNDTLLPLSSSYLPTRVGGEYYVPYAVFGNVGVRSSYDSSQQMLVLSAGERSLTFLIAQGYVYDQNMKPYDSPAYSLNGQIYVPVRVVCGRFGLSFSLITSTSAQILRICGSGAAQSDSSFLNSTKTRLEAMVNAYNGMSSAAEPNVPDGAEEPVKPSLVYLTFFNAPGKHTSAILDTLDDAGRTATFFLSPELEEADTELLRRIVGEGHAVGLALNANGVSPDALVEAAAAGNALLLEETGATTRIVTILAGSKSLTSAQLEALISAGYRLWDTTLDSRDNELSANRTAKTVTTAFSGTSSPVVVRFRDRDATPGALQTVLGYMRTNSITSAEISVLSVPINQRGDVR